MSGEYQVALSTRCVDYIDALEDLAPYKVLIQLTQEGVWTTLAKSYTA
jgi:hypothetical protein